MSVESRDVMHGNSIFLNRESLFADAVDNKHNMKNTRYSHRGGSSALHFGNLVVKSDAYRQSGLNSELCRVKESHLVQKLWLAARIQHRKLLRTIFNMDNMKLQLRMLVCWRVPLYL